VTRQVIPAGAQDRPLRTLEPIVRLLIERGHPPFNAPDKLGFHPTPGGWVCSLEGALTAADWEAVQERFELPPTIVFQAGCIRDHANWIDIEGVVTQENPSWTR
jgi:hypothetical protein